MSEVVLDANVLLRLLTGEPHDLADRAKAIIAEAERKRVFLVLTPLTLAEVVFVLQSVYDRDRKEVAEQLLDLISAPSLTVLDRPALQQALIWYRDVHGIHFADAYVAAVATARGHGRVASFDRHVGRLPGVTAIQQVADL